MDDWFTAANLNTTLARPGHQPSLTAGSLLASQRLDLARSQLHNTELWLTIDSAALAAELAALFDEATDPHDVYRLELTGSERGERLEWQTEVDGKAVAYRIEPAASPWLKLWRAVLGVLISEDML